MGGYSILTVTGGDKTTDPEIFRFPDVNGFRWDTQKDYLYFTSSPVYGKPGVYCFDVNNKNMIQLVAPTNRSKAYPDGADWFQLDYIQGSDIVYYYCVDVDAMDSVKQREIRKTVLKCTK